MPFYATRIIRLRALCCPLTKRITCNLILQREQFIAADFAEFGRAIIIIRIVVGLDTRFYVYLFAAMPNLLLRRARKKILQSRVLIAR